MNSFWLQEVNAEKIKAMISQHQEFVSILLLVLIASIHVPTEVHSPLFLLLCPLIFLYKNEVYAKKEFRFLFYFFCSYLLIFTLFSQDLPKSLVADYKVIQGIFFFPFAGLFFFFMKEIKRVIYHSIILFFFVIANFLFVKEHIVPDETYFSYYYHPNMAGFSLFFLIILALFLWSLAKTKAEKILNFATVFSALVLIVISNSRSIWIGMIAFALLGIFLAKTIERRLRFSLLFSLLFCAALLFFYFDNKIPLGSMSIRTVVWTTMYDETMHNHPLVGFGFNTYKDFFAKIDELATMPHNSIMEIFQSSGIIGTLMMAAVVASLLAVIARVCRREENAANSRVVIISCSALIALLVISLFDFRFFDYKFMATAMVFMGLLNGVMPTPAVPAPRGGR